MEAITTAVHELASLSVRVLSPADPRVVAAQGEFLFVASDRVRSVRLVQDRHLESIRAANFLWLVCPDGYVGQSASMEVGFAAAAGVPIYATHPPTDLTLREYVTVVATIREAVRRQAVAPRPRCVEGILINPHPSIEAAHDALEKVKGLLDNSSRPTDPAATVYHELTNVHRLLHVPTLQ
jgi:hypothetical protein